jgi:hypothetical protein
MHCEQRAMKNLYKAWCKPGASKIVRSTLQRLHTGVTAEEEAKRSITTAPRGTYTHVFDCWARPDFEGSLNGMRHIARKCKLRIEVILQVTSKLPRQKQMSRYLSATSNLLKQKQMSRYLLATSKTAQAKTNVTLFVGDIKDVQRVKEPLFFNINNKGAFDIKKAGRKRATFGNKLPVWKQTFWYQEQGSFDIKNFGRKWATLEKARTKLATWKRTNGH